MKNQFRVSTVTAALVATGLLLCSLAESQENKGAKDGKSGKGPGGAGGPGEKGRTGPMRGGAGGEGAKSEFKRLSEEERNRIRAAIREVWSDPDVVEARENLGRASRDYRATLHEALAQADPEMLPILTKMIEHLERPGHSGGGTGGPGGKGGAKPGGPGSSGPGGMRRLPGGMHAGPPAELIAQDLMRNLDESRREEFLQVHRSIMDSGQLKQALSKISEAEGAEERRPAIMALRKRYRELFIAESPKLAELLPPAGQGPGVKNGERSAP